MSFDRTKIGFDRIFWLIGFISSLKEMLNENHYKVHAIPLADEFPTCRLKYAISRNSQLTNIKFVLFTKVIRIRTDIGHRVQYTYCRFTLIFLSSRVTNYETSMSDTTVNLNNLQFMWLVDIKRRISVFKIQIDDKLHWKNLNFRTK